MITHYNEQPNPAIFQVFHTVSSKKNAWRRGANGGVYLPEKEQADIDALIILFKQERNSRKNMIAREWPIKGPISVYISIYRDKPKVDLDNAGTTILDVLQKAGIIENDNQAKRLSFSYVEGEGVLSQVNVSIYQLEKE